jgi:hypothetical protein
MLADSYYTYAQRGLTCTEIEVTSSIVQIDEEDELAVAYAVTTSETPPTTWTYLTRFSQSATWPIACNITLGNFLWLVTYWYEYPCVYPPGVTDGVYDGFRGNLASLTNTIKITV